MDVGKFYTFEELNAEIQSLLTSDVDSLEITGGEPLLHSEYILGFLKKYDYRAMLETNATLPANLESLVDVIDIVSMDIKLPEYFDTKEEWLNVYDHELKSIRVMENNNMKYYIKMVVSPTTPVEIIEDILKDLVSIVSSDVELIIQPVSPMTLWQNKENLFTLSEIVGKHFKVSIIPQIHKYMEIE